MCQKYVVKVNDESNKQKSKLALNNLLPKDMSLQKRCVSFLIVADVALGHSIAKNVERSCQGKKNPVFEGKSIG